MGWPSAALVLVAAALSVECAVYDSSLLAGRDDADNAAGAGSSNASGGSTGVTQAGGSDGSNAGGQLAFAGSDSGSGSGATGSGLSGSAGTPAGAAAGEGNQASGGTSAGGTTAGAGGSGPSELVLDDMEDGNYSFFLGTGSRGRWYLSNDGSAGTQTPAIEQLMAVIPGGREQSLLALHTAASGFSGWGASVGFTFENGVGQRAPFDASGYTAIAFYARAEPGSATQVWVALPDSNTDPLGGVCGQDPDAGSDACLDHFGKSLELGESFEKYVIEFDQVAQKGWGHAEPALKSSQLLGLEISWGTTSVDLWLDDISLLP